MSGLRMLTLSARSLRSRTSQICWCGSIQSMGDSQFDGMAIQGTSPFVSRTLRFVSSQRSLGGRHPGRASGSNARKRTPATGQRGSRRLEPRKMGSCRQRLEPTIDARRDVSELALSATIGLPLLRRRFPLCGRSSISETLEQADSLSYRAAGQPCHLSPLSDTLGQMKKSPWRA
jgi:hypothetical protein